MDFDVLKRRWRLIRNSLHLGQQETGSGEQGEYKVDRLGGRIGEQPSLKVRALLLSAIFSLAGPQQWPQQEPHTTPLQGMGSTLHT